MNDCTAGAPIITLRTVTEADAAALAAIYAPYVTDTTVTFEYDVPDAAEFSRRIAETAPVYPYLCAVIDEKIVGYAYAHRYGARKAYDWAAETSVYVDRAQHETGVGRTLYHGLLALLAMQNIVNACAIIAIPNPASVAFHTALGFSRTGNNLGIGYKKGRWLDTATYIRCIGKHETPPAPFIPFSALETSDVARTLRQFGR